jgi:hypothetical protein
MSANPFDRLLKTLTAAQKVAEAGLQRRGCRVQAPTPQQQAREAVQRAKERQQ